MYECIVIGGGVVGSSAAYHLAKKGKTPLLLEQFSLPHTRGSSHGATRLLRTSYEDPIYSRMTVETLQLWKHLEKECNTRLFRNTGLVVLGEPPHDVFERSFKSVQAVGWDCREIKIEEMEEKYRSIMKFSPNDRVYMEYPAGTLRADKALACLREQIIKFGGHIQDEERVTSITPAGKIVTVNTSKGTYQTNHLIISPGAWISQLLEPLGLKIPFEVKRVLHCYWKENVTGATKDMPAVIDVTKDTMGLPSSEYSGLMKICCDVGVETNPDCRDDCMNDKRDIEFLCNYVKERFPGVSCRPSIVEPCMYTLTPDLNFVLDNIPGHPNIVFGAGFSGHGFKMSPVVGRILGEMVLGEKLLYDVSSLSIKRFPGATLPSNAYFEKHILFDRSVCS